jgi:signal transduction histidine kinase
VKELLERLRPRSYRARIALAIGVGLVLSLLVIQIVVRVLIDQNLQASVERNLESQAQAVAFAVQRDGVGGAPEAARYLPDTSVVVRQDGLVVYWNDFSVQHLDATATATRGDISVTLEREADAGVLASWVVPSLLALAAVGVGALIWMVAGRLARRLSASAGALADTAEAVAEGDLRARAPVSEDELGRLAAAFNRMAERLEAAEGRQRAFLADVAHELRTPVTAIEGFAGALADGTAARPEDQAEAAEFIRDEAARLRELIRDLQELTWLDLDPPLRRERVDLAELGRTALGRQAAAAHEAEVALAGPEGHAEAMTDPAHVGTILANLLSNAIRHTPAGGRVTVEVGQEGPSAWVAVSDTGVGIAPEHLPYLFERLYRVGSARDRDGRGGSGLGLSIVKRLATLLGGTVAVRSVPGDGSTFTLTLPRGLPPSAQRPPRAPAAAGRAPSR